MRVLFIMRHHGYVKNFESALAALAERGHDVHLGFNTRVDGIAGEPTLQATAELAARYPNLTYAPTPPRDSGRWADFAVEVHAALDWLRYLAPAFAGAEKVRERTQRRAPAVIKRLAETPLGRGRGLGLFMGVLRTVERSLPVSPEIVEYVRAQRPDLVLVTPLVDGGTQVPYARAAARVGAHTGLCVSSWDNLTSKGLIHEVPEVITLWNEAQRREAVELHAVPPERVVPTGAQAYDHWFEWRPSTTREAFCRPIGLDPARPVLLYMCSSGFIAGREVEHVTQWIAALRDHPDPDIAGMGILVRPHPVNAKQWYGEDLSHLENVALWKLEGTEPATQRNKEEYFDSIHHAVAVVGLNSSSLIESAIIGRPVLTLLTPEYERSQRGMPHFGLIAGGDSAVLSVASTTDEHVEQIRRAVAGDGFAGRRERFLEAFVRPQGLEVPATERLVATLEEVAARPRPAPRREPAYAPAVRVLLTPLTVLPETLLPTARDRKRLRRRVERRYGRWTKRMRRTADRRLRRSKLAKRVKGSGGTAPRPKRTAVRERELTP